MEVWLSSSAGATRLDQNRIAAPFNDVFYKGILGQVPNGFTNIIVQDQSVTITIPTGYDIYEYNLATDTTPFNILPINTNTTYRLYRVTGVPFSGPNSETFRQNLGFFWANEASGFSNSNYTFINLYSQLTSPGGGGSSDLLSFRRSVVVDTSGAANPGDLVVFRFFVDSNTTGITSATINANGTLKVVPSNNTLTATDTKVCVDQTQNAFFLSSSLSPYYGPAYFFNPLDAAVSASYANLYLTYGDILYPFVLEENDKIVAQIESPSGSALVYTVASSSIAGGTGNVYIYTKEDIDGYFGNLCDKFYRILFLKRLQDETSIILDFPKPAGKTSYGFNIPQNINPAVLDNIDQITKNVNQQLIDVGISTTT